MAGFRFFGFKKIKPGNLDDEMSEDQRNMDQEVNSHEAPEIELAAEKDSNDAKHEADPNAHLESTDSALDRLEGHSNAGVDTRGEDQPAVDNDQSNAGAPEDVDSSSEPIDEPNDSGPSISVEADSNSAPVNSSINIGFVFPNAKDGEAYEIPNFKEQVFGESADQVSHYYLNLPEGCGLGLHAEEDSFGGNPELVDNEPQIIDIVLYYHLKHEPRGYPYTHNLKLVINPDARKLWKNIPSDAKCAYWKQDDVCSELDETSGTLIAASKRGRSHAHEGSCRDDHYEIKYLHKSGWWLSIVADGAGSAKFSRRGSEIACTSGLQFFENGLSILEDEQTKQAIKSFCSGDTSKQDVITASLRELLIKQVSYQAFIKIFEHAKKQGDRLKDYNTTFLVSAWTQVNDGWFVCAFAIGDGGIAVLSSDNVQPLTKGDEGEFSGETMFLTTNSVWENSTGILERVNFGYFTDIRGIYSMSDGISDPKFETDQNFSDLERWESLANEIDQHIADHSTEKRPSEALIDWMGFWSPGNHDDRTITIFKPSNV